MLFPILLLPVHSAQVIMSSVIKGPAKFEQQLPSSAEVFTPESSIIYVRSNIEQILVLPILVFNPMHCSTVNTVRRNTFFLHKCMQNLERFTPRLSPSCNPSPEVVLAEEQHLEREIMSILPPSTDKCTSRLSRSQTFLSLTKYI